MKYTKFFAPILMLIMGYLIAEHEILLPSTVKTRYFDINGITGCSGDVVRKKEVFNNGILIAYENIKINLNYPFRAKLFKIVDQHIHRPSDLNKKIIIDTSETVDFNIKEQHIGNTLIHAISMEGLETDNPYITGLRIYLGDFQQRFVFAEHKDDIEFTKVMKDCVSTYNKNLKISKINYTVSAITPILLYYIFLLTILLFKKFKKR